MNNERINRVLAGLKQIGLSQMLIIDPLSIYYLTGVSVVPMERFYALYINANGKNVLFLNKLFKVPEVDIKQVWMSDTDPVMDIVSEYIDHKLALGVDKDMKACHLLPLMYRGAAAGFANASIAVDFTRAIKDAAEQDKMREASKLNDLAMGRFKELIHEGVTEKQVADQMLSIYLEIGADGYSFEPIVSFGANAADPHHEPDDTVIKPGDCVLFDVGCIKNGYCSDMTRTFYYKYADDHCRQVYDIVRSANETAEKKAAPGIKVADIDAAARDYISQAGFGEYFTHRLGHFIGINVHEYGDVSAASTWETKPGMTFSIEPGIYLPNDTGVRIEDLVLVTENGVEVLNSYPHELQIIE